MVEKVTAIGGRVLERVRKKSITKIHSDYQYHQEQKQQQFDIRKKKLVRRLIGIGLIAIAMAIVIVSVNISQSSNIQSRLNEKSELEAQLEQLKSEEKMLKENIVRLEDEDYIAKLARDQYFLSEKGEVIFKFSE
jgi:cell division protein DivIC